MIQLKNVLTSKTELVNLLGLVVGILGAMGSWSLAQDYAPYITIALAAANAVLRLLTTTPVSFTAPVKAKDLLR